MKPTPAPKPTLTLALLTLTVALLGAAVTAQANAQTPGPVPTEPPAAGCVAVEVQNVRPQQGHLMAAAYGSADTFGKTPLAQIRVAAGDAVTRFELCGLPLTPGTSLAITMFQDLDSDGAMGRNVLGVPTEPWGASGAPGPFGPTWETARVPLDGSVVVIKLAA